MIQLTRFHRAQIATLGVIHLPGAPFPFFTLEPAAQSGVLKFPAIPDGDYHIHRDTDGNLPPKYKARFGHPHMFQVLGEPLGTRTGINFHIGNAPKDTEGCILIGKLAQFHPDPCVFRSRESYLMFWEQLNAFFQQRGGTDGIPFNVRTV